MVANLIGQARGSVFPRGLFHVLFGLNNVTYANFRASQIAPSGVAGADYDLYTVPSGKRAVIFALFDNTSLSINTFFYQVKIGGVYYRTTGNITAAARPGAGNGVGFGLVLESGDIASIHTLQTALVLSSVVGATAVYTGTITGGGSNAYAGKTFVIEGFVNGGNNGTFVCTASSTTTLTFAPTTQVNETHAGTAAEQSGLNGTGVIHLFDDTSPLKSPRVADPAFASGNHTIYTVPANKIALSAGWEAFFGPGGNASSSIGSLFNQSGSNANFLTYIVPAAGSPSDANLMNAGTANNNSGASFQMPHLMSSGETYVINTNQTGKQIAWINIFEEPT